jgi:phage FluMu protein Com
MDDADMLEEIRCGACGRKLAMAQSYARLEIKCTRCGVLNVMRAASPQPARLGASQPKGACDGEETELGGHPGQEPTGLARRQKQAGRADRGADSRAHGLR